MKRFIVFTIILLVTQPAIAGRKKKTPELPEFEVADTLATYANPGRLAPNGLFFVCGLTDDDGGELLYYWSREKLKGDWEGPFLIDGKVNDIVPTVGNMQPTVSPDGLRIVFVRNEENSWESNDLWMAVRSSMTEPFDSVRALEELNTYNVEAYPYISSGSDRLYYTFMEGLMCADYDEETGYYVNPDTVQLDWQGLPTSCWVSADEKTLVFNDGLQLYYADRSSIEETFILRDTFLLSEDVSFRAGPSFDANGEMYLYVPGSYDYDEEYYDEDYEDYFEGDGEGLEDDEEFEVVDTTSIEESEYIYESAEPERLNNVIIRLRPQGRLPFDI